MENKFKRKTGRKNEHVGSCDSMWFHPLDVYVISFITKNKIINMFTKTCKTQNNLKNKVENRGKNCGEKGRNQTRKSISKKKIIKY